MMGDYKCTKCGGQSANKVYDLPDRSKMYCYICGEIFYVITKDPDDGNGDRLRELANAELGQMFLSAGEGKGA